MIKIYRNKCKKYKELKESKISNICDKLRLLSSICNECGREDEGIFKEEGSIEILKVLVLINNT